MFMKELSNLRYALVVGEEARVLQGSKGARVYKSLGQAKIQHERDKELMKHRKIKEPCRIVKLYYEEMEEE